MEYLWEQGIQSTHYPHLDGDISTDVLVIGGGMAGVLCARQLAKAGADCVLVEAKRIGSGVTKGTTAVLTAQHDTLYTDLISSFGREKAKLYLDANLRAVERYQALSRDIPCAFEERPSVMYSLTDAETLRKEAAAAGLSGRVCRRGSHSLKGCGRSSLSWHGAIPSAKIASRRGAGA